MIGVGFDINGIADGILPSIDIINAENPLYTNYLNSDYDKDINEFLKKYSGKKIITDGAYIDLNPASGEVEILHVVKKKVRQSIDFALKIGSSEIIFLSTFLPMIGMDFYDNAHISNSIDFWKETADEYKNIRISLCNTFEYTPHLLLQIVNGVERDNFGLAFDIGHAFAYGEITLKDFFEPMNHFCESVYIHSNNQTADEHLNLFEGSLLKSEQFQTLIPLLVGKNLILKPFDKSRIKENTDTGRICGSRSNIRARNGRLHPCSGSNLCPKIGVMGWGIIRRVPKHSRNCGRELTRTLRLLKS